MLCSLPNVWFTDAERSRGNGTKATFSQKLGWECLRLKSSHLLTIPGWESDIFVSGRMSRGLIEEEEAQSPLM